MNVELVRTGTKIAFLKVGIGNPFYAHNGMWIRIDYDAAKRLAPSDMHASCCSFTIDACDEFVEFVNVIVEVVPMLDPQVIAAHSEAL
jgi:hypothetical protein